MRVLSIGLITCNRPEGLRLLLESLARQTISEANASAFSWYVHVTDNDLSGENPKVVAAVRTRFPDLDVRLAEEPMRGIPAARNRSVLETRDADALIYIDDDEEAPDGWLDAMMTMWRETSADVITGPVDAVLPEGAPQWAKASGVFEKNQSYPRGHRLSKAYTNNTLVVRKVLDHIGPTFDERFQFTGSSDLHYFLRVVAAGFTIQWCPEARLLEHVPMSRIRYGWIVRRGFRSGSGEAQSLLLLHPRLRAMRMAFGNALARIGLGGVQILLCPITRWRGLIVGSKRVASGVGGILGLFGVSHQEYLKIHGK